jgi:hypothetical protein
MRRRQAICDGDYLAIGALAPYLLGEACQGARPPDGNATTGESSP